MNYQTTRITSEGTRSILVIYTGGTFGMVKDASGTLVPFNFENVIERVPELKNIGMKLTVVSFNEPIDSSDLGINEWTLLAKIIEEHYESYHGFVILHGTDTMSYSASMLSYMLQGLNKPVIFTGAQMPIGFLRSDARENFITALEIASATANGAPIISEVCIYFNFVLLRGNRAQKVRSSSFTAFESENYPHLAKAGIDIEYNHSAIRPYNPNAILDIEWEIDPQVALLTIYPSITESVVKSILAHPNSKGIVLQSFGAGNVMSFEWFHRALEEASQNGKIILNISQCIGGTVAQGMYETSKKLTQIGVISGKDITPEAAITKLMFLLGNETDPKLIRKKLAVSIAGEMD